MQNYRLIFLQKNLRVIWYLLSLWKGVIQCMKS